jgi:hypothetical protein
VDISLTDIEAAYLADILDFWIEDREEVNREITQDRTLESPEEMLEAVESMNDLFSMALNIQGRLRKRKESLS